MKEQVYNITALDIAREITVAKLSTASPPGTNKKIGEDIGEMFAEIYNAVLAVMSDSEEK